MTYINHKVWFIEPEIPHIPYLSQLQPPLGGIIDGHSSAVTIDDKDIRYIADRLKNKQKISEIEWLILLRSEEKYLLLDHSEQSIILAIVWTNLLLDEPRFQQFLLKIIAGFARGFSSMAGTLLKAFPARTTSKHPEKTKQLSEIVKHLVKGDYLSCAKKMLDSNTEVALWFSSYGADSAGEHVEAIYTQAGAALPMSPDSEALAWWLTCQRNIEDKQTLAQLELLLAKVNYVQPGCEFDEWIQIHCLPDNADTFWYQLSEFAQQKLKSFYHVTTFKSVKKIFDALCDTSTDPNLTETHVRNLAGRTSFWADYSESFVRVRFLLTQRSKELLANKMDLRQERVTIMVPHYSNDASEICIFEIGSYIFIERFRGSDFDLGIFLKSAGLEKLLFDSDGLDGRIVSQLTPEWAEDHKDYWQKRLISVLSSKGIKPNLNNKLARNWFTPLSASERHQVDEMKLHRNQNNLDNKSYFKTGHRQR